MSNSLLLDIVIKFLMYKFTDFELFMLKEKTAHYKNLNDNYQKPFMAVTRPMLITTKEI